MQRSVCIRVIRKNMIYLNFNIQGAAQLRSRWNQAREVRLTDERGVRDDEEIVGGLGLDFARAGWTREGGDFSIGITRRKSEGSRRGLEHKQPQRQSTGDGFFCGEN